MVAGVLQDLETCELPEREKALLRFIGKVNHQSPAISMVEIQALNAAGWTDEAIYYAITVCALFNFYNRWIDASGVHPMSEQAHREFGARTAQHGYVRK